MDEPPLGWESCLAFGGIWSKPQCWRPLSTNAPRFPSPDHARTAQPSIPPDPPDFCIDPPVPNVGVAQRTQRTQRDRAGRADGEQMADADASGARQVDGWGTAAPEMGGAGRIRTDSEDEAKRSMEQFSKTKQRAIAFDFPPMLSVTTRTIDLYLTIHGQVVDSRSVILAPG